MPEEFELVAAWIGEEPAREQAVTRSELMTLVSRNELGNAVRYRVGAAQPAGKGSVAHFTLG